MLTLILTSGESHLYDWYPEISIDYHSFCGRSHPGTNMSTEVWRYKVASGKPEEIFSDFEKVKLKEAKDWRENRSIIQRFIDYATDRQVEETLFFCPVSVMQYCTPCTLAPHVCLSSRLLVACIVNRTRNWAAVWLLIDLGMRANWNRVLNTTAPFTATAAVPFRTLCGLSPVTSTSKNMAPNLGWRRTTRVPAQKKIRSKSNRPLVNIRL